MTDKKRITKRPDTAYSALCLNDIMVLMEKMREALRKDGEDSLFHPVRIDITLLGKDLDVNNMPQFRDIRVRK